ncbi:surface antigen BspA-like [Trichomonas vaginalis G3]|uniref:Surface antigen BspA-like n=1 Tax=Trichomonas vaginalis (strain ATCC PRA-98 / G3) TaxID=412133 RepID=A2G1T7_TRIV3|nr:surface antigen family [Trichomonas vaginalis G3]EAX88888.1 surface antigen BspA-like [Trichomonas vaginalis G3]KAI5508536.1 surface antigen family [Trichomonas vaginalis G3]|eukprot:XP_001301818.1 surface antigen BspA-like [Trichomonas vaginalis G3]
MNMLFLAVIYKDIDPSCYSADGKNLTSVNDTSSYLRISAKCEIVEYSCFYGLKSLISFTFEEKPNLTLIGPNGFGFCDHLTKIDLSFCHKLKIISAYAFYFCDAVEEILLPEGLLEIHGIAFGFIDKVKCITIPASVKIIQDSAFSEFTSLQSITFAEGSELTYLDNIFSGSFLITSFEIPENVAKVNGNVFFGTAVKNISIHHKNKYLILVDDTIYSSNKSILFCSFKYSSGEYEIPNDVITLGERCFYGLTLNNIIIPENVKRIEEYAFALCYDLNSVTIKGILEYIGDKIFYDCFNMETIYFPFSTMIVNAELFCPLHSSNLRMIFTNKTLFSNDAIGKETKVSISYLDESDLFIFKNSLIMNSIQTLVYEFWGYNYTTITIPNSVTTIKERAFESSSLNNIHVEKDSSLSVIENLAFNNCSNLESFDLTNLPLSSIGFSAFKGCSKLTHIRFWLSKLILMDNAFENCISLKSVSNIFNIPERCFAGCINLREISFCENTEIIGIRAFENCYSLETITIPASVQIISEYSFLNCRKLKSITFSSINSLSFIAVNSISVCDSLTNISNFESDKYKSIDNTLYRKNESGEYLIYHLSNSINDMLTVNCDTICSYSFNHSNNIQKIKIVSVYLIEEFSFNNCINLKYINFPLSVQTVQPIAFNECRSIKCPLIIENQSSTYIKMLVDSGIPQSIITSCKNSRSPNIDKLLLDNFRKARRH